MQKCRRGKRVRLKIFAGLRTRKTFIKTLKGVLLRAPQSAWQKQRFSSLINRASNAELKTQQKSEVFAVCGALAAEFLVLLSRFIKVGALPLSDVREKYLKGFYNIFRVPKLPNNTNEYALCGDLLTF